MVPREDKLPWFQAVCVVLPQLPYLRKECVRAPYRRSRNPLTGFCYAASEAIFHLSEDPLQPWFVRYGPLDHQTHWFLKLAETGEVIDVTASQFSDMDAYALYDHAIRKGFLTKEPSKRARAILARVDRRHYWVKRADICTPHAAEKRYVDAKELRKAKRRAENSNPKAKDLAAVSSRAPNLTG